MSASLAALSAPLADTTLAGFSVFSLLLAGIVGAAILMVVFGLTSKSDEVDEVTRRLERYSDPNRVVDTTETNPGRRGHGYYGAGPVGSGCGGCEMGSGCGGCGMSACASCGGGGRHRVGHRGHRGGRCGRGCR